MNFKKMKIEKFCNYIFCTLATFFFVLLNFYAIRSSYHNYDFKDEIVTFTKDNVITNILLVLLIYLIFGIVYYFLRKRLFVDTYKIAKIVSLVVIVIGLIWTTTLLSYPMADQEFVLFSSAKIDAGDYSDLAKGGYLGMHPHQLGLMTYYRLLNRIFGNFNYRGAQLVNCFLGGLITYAGYNITSLLSNKNKLAEIVYLLLILFCAPFYGYMPYVYGEIPSITFLSLTFWTYLSICEEPKIYKYLLLFVFSTTSTLLKQNSIIFIIGILIAAIIKLLSEYKDIHKALLCLTILLSMCCPSQITNCLYQKHIPSDSEPFPTIVWMAMGTNTDNEDCYGYWNNYLFDLLYKNDFDMSKCNEEASLLFKEFINKCIEDTSFMLNFYSKKFVTQWNVPLYQSVVMSNVVSENLTPFAEDILYTGDNIREYSNIYQLLVYSATLIYILTSAKNNNINNYVILIGIFGGFIFSLIWEAKARYIFPYFIMMIPCASVGIKNLIQAVIKNEK